VAKSSATTPDTYGAEGVDAQGILPVPGKPADVVSIEDPPMGVQ
jgi:hypothetical protein